MRYILQNVSRLLKVKKNQRGAKFRDEKRFDGFRHNAAKNFLSSSRLEPADVDRFGKALAS